MPGLLERGIDLAIYGMGTVFVFLTVLVLLTMLMSRLLGQTTDSGTGSSVDPTTLAVISAAIRAYRHKHRY